jgi:hypothetical protein
MSTISFVKRINWRHILVHFIAMWLIVHGTWFLSYLTDIELLAPRRNGDPAFMSWTDGDMLTRRMAFLMNIGIFVACGKIGGFILSLLITLWRKWYWLNPVIGFAALTGLTRAYDISHYNSAGQLYHLPGSVFESTFLSVLVSGVLLLTAGLLLLFLKPVNQFIIGRQQPLNTIA